LENEKKKNGELVSSGVDASHCSDSKFVPGWCQAVERCIAHGSQDRLGSHKVRVTRVQGGLNSAGGFVSTALAAPTVGILAVRVAVFNTAVRGR